MRNYISHGVSMTHSSLRQSVRSRDNDKKICDVTALTENGLSSGAAVPEPGAPKGLSSNPLDDICIDLSARILYLFVSH